MDSVNWREAFRRRVEGELTPQTKFDFLPVAVPEGRVVSGPGCFYSLGKNEAYRITVDGVVTRIPAPGELSLAEEGLIRVFKTYWVRILRNNIWWCPETGETQPNKPSSRIAPNSFGIGVFGRALPVAWMEPIPCFMSPGTHWIVCAKYFNKEIRAKINSENDKIVLLSPERNYAYVSNGIVWSIEENKNDQMFVNQYWFNFEYGESFVKSLRTGKDWALKLGTKKAVWVTESCGWLYFFARDSRGSYIAKPRID